MIGFYAIPDAVVVQYYGYLGVDSLTWYGTLNVCTKDTTRDREVVLSNAVCIGYYLHLICILSSKNQNDASRELLCCFELILDRPLPYSVGYFRP